MKDIIIKIIARPDSNIERLKCAAYKLFYKQVRHYRQAEYRGWQGYEDGQYKYLFRVME